MPRPQPPAENRHKEQVRHHIDTGGDAQNNHGRFEIVHAPQNRAQGTASIDERNSDTADQQVASGGSQPEQHQSVCVLRE